MSATRCKTNPALPPKLSVPQLDRVILRERLFTQLDRCLSGHLLWIEGMAGAGKTVLAASYLAVRYRPFIWYTLDESDADPATWFHYLERGWQRLVEERNLPSLPILGREYLADPAGFARIFFRAFFDRLPQPAIIVFDDYHTLPLHAPLYPLLNVMVSEAPAQVGIMILSRRPPPVELARWQVDGRLQVLGDESLSLIWDEFQSMAALHSADRAPPSEPALRALYAKSGGWPAGAALLLRPFRQEAAMNPRLVFDYFTAEIFNRLVQPTQDFLVNTACLPYLQPAVATALTGHPHAAELLDTLVREHYFTARIGDGVYRYHDLFRDFLQARARAVLTDSQRRERLQTAARLLGNEGAVEDAARLLVKGELWEDLSVLVLEQAPELVAQGRYGLLEDWLRRLPEPLLANNPQLLYWRGSVRLPFDMARARIDLEQAYRVFRNTGDLNGAVLTWAAIIESYSLEFADFSPLDGWIAEATGLEAEGLEGLPADCRARFILGMFTALICRQPDRPDILDWAEQVEQLIRVCPDPGRRIQMGCLYRRLTAA